MVDTSRHRSQICLVFFTLGLLLGSAAGNGLISGETEAQTSDAEQTPYGDIVTECRAALDPNGTGLCRVVVYQQTSQVSQPIPQRVVVYDSAGKTIWNVLRDGDYLIKTDLLQYFEVTNLVAADVDSDGAQEAVITWDSDCAGSGWIQTLEVLDYDMTTGGFISHRGERVAGPFGGFEVLPLDEAGAVPRVIGYSFQSEGRTSRIWDLECRWCPHRYRVAAYTIGPDGLVVDPHWNSGQVARTQLRFDSEAYATLAPFYVHSGLFNALASAAPFVVLSPTANQTVSPGVPLRVEFPLAMSEIGVRVVGLDANGEDATLLDDVLLGTSWDEGNSLGAEDYLYYTRPARTTGRVVLYDPRDPGDPSTTMTIPIEFAEEELIDISVFFPNRQIPSPTLGVEPVYPVRRIVRASDDIAMAALELLFRGPTAGEEKAGYFTYLVPECKAQDFHYPEHPCSDKVASLEIIDGVAQVALLYGVDWSSIIWQLGGIVGLETALEQVRATLLSLPGIERVVIW